MTQASIHIDGIEELLATLDGQRIFKTVLLAAGQTMEGHARNAYPPAPVGRKQPFKTDKQRRGFFAKLRSGEIQVPYQRGSSPGSEALNKRWTTKLESDTQVVVGNNTSYGELVMGDKQAAFHRDTGWKTIQTIVDDNKPAIEEEIKKVADLFLSSRGKL